MKRRIARKIRKQWFVAYEAAQDRGSLWWCLQLQITRVAAPRACDRPRCRSRRCIHQPPPPAKAVRAFAALTAAEKQAWLSWIPERAPKRDLVPRWVATYVPRALKPAR